MKKLHANRWANRGFTLSSRQVRSLPSWPCSVKWGQLFPVSSCHLSWWLRKLRSRMRQSTRLRSVSSLKCPYNFLCGLYNWQCVHLWMKCLVRHPDRRLFWFLRSFLFHKREWFWVIPSRHTDNFEADFVVVVENSDDSSKSGIRPTLCLCCSSPCMWAILSKNEPPTILLKLPTQFLVTSYAINLSYKFLAFTECCKSESVI